MAATYKFEGYESRNPVMFALRCAETHISMLDSILKKHGDQEIIKLNDELKDLINEGKNYYCLNFSPSREEEDKEVKKALINGSVKQTV